VNILKIVKGMTPKLTSLWKNDPSIDIIIAIKFPIKAPIVRIKTTIKKVFYL
jgi:hypothetical protein